MTARATEFAEMIHTMAESEDVSMRDFLTALASCYAVGAMAADLTAVQATSQVSSVIDYTYALAEGRVQ